MSTAYCLSWNQFLQSSMIVIVVPHLLVILEFVVVVVFSSSSSSSWFLCLVSLVSLCMIGTCWQWQEDDGQGRGATKTLEEVAVSLVGSEDVLVLENYTGCTMLKTCRFTSFFPKQISNQTCCGCFSVDFHVDVVILGQWACELQPWVGSGSWSPWQIK